MRRPTADLVALCQFPSGPASSKLGIALGIARGGLQGGFAAWLGFTLPSAIALILFALGFERLGFSTNTRWLQVLLDADEREALRSQSVISNAPGRGGRRYAPYAFTEQGVAMLSFVLNSPRAIAGILDAIRALMHSPELTKKRRIGFVQND